MTEIRTLVTGGAGFLGVHLIEDLLRDGRRVMCVDNLSSGSRSKLEHIAAAVDFIEADITAPHPQSARAILEFEPHEIYNLACIASPPLYQKAPVNTMATNVMGTMNLLLLAETIDARLVQASSSEVYGDPEVSPQPESYRGNVNPIGPRACYDEGKRAAEALCSDFVRDGNSVGIARIFNTYGPGMHLMDGRVLPNFIRQALSGNPLTVYGSGSQTRSFCFVSDTIAALRALMDRKNIHEPINIGNPNEEITIFALAQLVNELTENTAGIVHEELPVDDPKQRRPDITRAREILGWEPKVPLLEGLGRVLASI